MGSLEAHTEGLPQYFVLTTLAIYNQALTSCNNPIELYFHFIGLTHNRNDNEKHFSMITTDIECLNRTKYYHLADDHIGSIHSNTTLVHESQTILWFLEVPMYYYFRFTYYTTLATCTFGIVKFLDRGPTRCLAPEGCLNYVGYICALFSVFYHLRTKSLGLGSDGTILDTVLSTFGYCNSNQTLRHDYSRHLHISGKFMTNNLAKSSFIFY